MNIQQHPLSIDDRIINETQLIFHGEGSNSRVWCDRHTAYKIPKIEIRDRSFALVLRDAFFQNIVDNYHTKLCFGRWMFNNNVPIMVNQTLSPCSIAPPIHTGGVGILIYDLVHQLYRINQYGIRHGDIHPHNICLDNTEEHFKLIDFDNAADITTTMLKHIKLPTICAPEVFNTEGITNSSEVWSLGLTVAMMCKGSIIKPTTQRACERIINEAEKGTLRDFLKDTLNIDPQKRLDIDTLAGKYSSKILHHHPPIPNRQVDWFEIAQAIRVLIEGVFCDDCSLKSMVICVEEAKKIRGML